MKCQTLFKKKNRKKKTIKMLPAAAVISGLRIIKAGIIQFIQDFKYHLILFMPLI